MIPPLAAAPWSQKAARVAAGRRRMVAMVAPVRDRRPVAWGLPFIGAGTELPVLQTQTATLVVRVVAVRGAVALAVMLPGIPGELVRRRVAALAVMPPTTVVAAAREVCVGEAAPEPAPNPTPIVRGVQALPGASS